MQVSIKRTSIVRVALASWIGTSIEWYDFYLYTTAAALVLGPLFFSSKLSPLAAEHSPAERRGFYGSWPQMGVPMGLLLSSLIFSLTTSVFSKQDFLSFGW